MKKFQYQGYVKPIDVTQPVGETITLDKWFQPLGEPVREHNWKKSLISFIAGAVLFFDINAAANANKFPEWNPKQNEPVRVVKNVNYITAGDFKWSQDIIEPKPDKWWRPLSEPVRVKENRNWVTAGDFKYDNEIIQPNISKWGQPISTPIWGAKQERYKYPDFNIGWDENILHPLIDKWGQPISIPTRNIIRAPEYAYFSFVGQISEPITLDKWFQLPQQPYLKIPNNYWTQKWFDIDATQLTLPEVIYFGAWTQPISQRLYEKQQWRFLYPELTFYNPQSLIEIITMDKWWRPLQEPTRPKVNIVLLPQGVIQLDKEQTYIQLDRYWVRANEPVRVKENRTWITPGILTLTHEQTFIGLDRYWRQLTEPVRVKQNNNWITYGDFKFEPSIAAIPLDRWMQPINQPYLRKQNNNWITQGKYETTQDIIITPFDRWMQPIGQPLFDKPKRNWVYPYSFFVSQIACVDSWGTAPAPITINGAEIIFLTDGRIAAKLDNNVYLPL